MSPNALQNNKVKSLYFYYYITFPTLFQQQQNKNINTMTTYKTFTHKKRSNILIGDKEAVGL